MQEMTVDSIRVSLMNYQRVVILKEMESDRHLPIWIGPAEADAIAVKLQGISVPRPLTHDLLQSVIDNLGAEISYIRINDLKNDTFFAKIGVSMETNPVEMGPSTYTCRKKPLPLPTMSRRAKIRARFQSSCPATIRQALL